MEDIRQLAGKITERLTALARSSAVMSKPISAGERHLVPLCELSVAFGSGGGGGEAQGDDAGTGAAKGIGGGAAGAAKATPVAVLIVDEQGVRIQALDV
ncbi:MAG: hypothetical protein JW940_33095 [Polyangiaceae bacterium]|nr:hypothetical protein [Polyangiaceae bacterium]